MINNKYWWTVKSFLSKTNKKIINYKTNRLYISMMTEDNRRANWPICEDWHQEKNPPHLPHCIASLPPPQLRKWLPSRKKTPFLRKWISHRADSIGAQITIILFSFFPTIIVPRDKYFDAFQTTVCSLKKWIIFTQNLGHFL